MFVLCTSIFGVILVLNCPNGLPFQTSVMLICLHPVIVAVLEKCSVLLALNIQGLIPFPPSSAKTKTFTF